MMTVITSKQNRAELFLSRQNKQFFWRLWLTRISCVLGEVLVVFLRSGLKRLKNPASLHLTFHQHRCEQGSFSGETFAEWQVRWRSEVTLSSSTFFSRTKPGRWTAELSSGPEHRVHSRPGRHSLRLLLSTTQPLWTEPLISVPRVYRKTPNVHQC